MSKITAYLIVCLCLSGMSVHAQYAERMRALRPGYGVSPWTVGERVFQAHMGFDGNWGAKTLTDAVLKHDSRIGSLNMCFGITERLEIDAYSELRNDKLDVNHAQNTISGISLAALGIRYNIIDGGLNGISAGLQALAKLPVQSSDYRVRQVLPKILFIIGWNPSDAITLSGNLGVEYDGIKDNPTTLYSIKAMFQLSNHIGAFIETHNTLQYSYPHKGVGLYAHLGRNVMIDVSTGSGFRRFQKDYYFNIGLSCRFAAGRTQRNRWVYGEYR